MNNRKSIPIYRPDLSGNEISYVLDCMQSSWISSKGSYIANFESQFSRYIGDVEAVSVCNGTVALHLALLALGVGPGDEVIVPTLTYIASANAVAYTGATPVFCDSEREYWQMDVEDIIRKLTPKTRAIMAVHLYGQACDMLAIKRIASDRGIFLIEDCAEAIGTRIGNQHVGTFGDISAFSFFGNKTITTGEGGMVVSRDKTLLERARRFKGQGLAAHREYWHDVIGYNYRMTNIEAAIGVAQLERVDEFTEKKRRVADLYRKLLNDCDVEFHKEKPGTTHSYWMNSVLIDESISRDAVREYLAKQGIETRPVFFPVHTMPMYSKSYRRHSVAESIAWRGINLPSWPGLSDGEVEYICNTLKAAIHHAK